MENNTFKSVAFGGFDKQDVIRYIEQSAREAADVQERLQQENDGLRTQVQSLEERAGALERRADEAEALCRSLEQQLSREQSAREALEREKAELQTLADEVRRLRPEAEAYAQFRDRVGDIECEAHKRSAALEAATAAKMRQVSDAFQTQYQTLMASFDATAAHVTSELRKIEVTLSQLPRAMDQPGAELKELSSMLDQQTEK